MMVSCNGALDYTGYDLKCTFDVDKKDMELLSSITFDQEVQENQEYYFERLSKYKGMQTDNLKIYVKGSRFLVFQYDRSDIRKQIMFYDGKALYIVDEINDESFEVNLESDINGIINYVFGDLPSGEGENINVEASLSKEKPAIMIIEKNKLNYMSTELEFNLEYGVVTDITTLSDGEIVGTNVVQNLKKVEEFDTIWNDYSSKYFK